MGKIVTSFANKKIYYRNLGEKQLEINRLLKNGRIRKIMSIRNATPDMTTDAHCSSVYYEYYL